MAKQRRVLKKTARPVKKIVAPKRSAPQKRVPPGRRRAASKREVTPAVAPALPPPAPRKPGFYEAVAIYERGVQALQRHDFTAAAGLFKTVLDRYPEERELLERARLYLRVCERETVRKPPVPKTAAELIYAATVALNSGQQDAAIEHLQAALAADPDSDHAHYTMAVALGMRSRTSDALRHLGQAIALNPENRSLARQDPDLDRLRFDGGFRAALDTPPIERRRPRSRS